MIVAYTIASAMKKINEKTKKKTKSFEVRANSPGALVTSLINPFPQEKLQRMCHMETKFTLTSDLTPIKKRRKGRLVKQSICPACRGELVIYQKEAETQDYSGFCFGCGAILEHIDPLRYEDAVKNAFLVIFERLRYKKEDIPTLATWRDIQIALIGAIDVRNLELFNLRKFFRQESGESSSQLTLYHLLKHKSDTQARR